MEATPGLVGKGMEQAVTAAAEELALQARTSSGAFGELYRQHREAVFRYLRARCRDEDLAVELTAVTFEKAFRGIGRYQTRGGGIVAWLLRIARNTATDHERHHRPAGPAMANEQPTAQPTNRRRRTWPFRRTSVAGSGSS